jgi:hypothetical protein
MGMGVPCPDISTAADTTFSTCLEVNSKSRSGEFNETGMANAIPFVRRSWSERREPSR